MTALQMTPDEALALADQWCAGLTMDADSKGWGAILLVLAEEVRRLREREAGLLEQHHRDSAELRRVCEARDDARADERTAMGYLAGVREIVGGEDFPDMVRRVESLKHAESVLRIAALQLADMLGIDDPTPGKIAAEIERLRGFLLDCHRVYSSGSAWRDKYLCDAIDNDGRPYQSQALADCLAAMEADNA